jgi:hypothetical protein
VAKDKDKYEVQKRWANKQRMRGLCVRCGKKRDKYRWLCNGCQKGRTAYIKKYREAIKAAKKAKEKALK